MDRIWGPAEEQLLLRAFKDQGKVNDCLTTWSRFGWNSCTGDLSLRKIVADFGVEILDLRRDVLSDIALSNWLFLCEPEEEDMFWTVLLTIVGPPNQITVRNSLNEVAKDYGVIE